MRTCRNFVVCSFLVVVLAPVVGGEQHQGIVSAKTQALHKMQASQKSVDYIHQQQARSSALDEIDAGPDPFFTDLVGRMPLEDDEQEVDQIVVGEVAFPRTRLVEVYENESRGLGRRWQKLRSGRLNAFPTPQWSYKDGSAALSPAEILPPDDWSWVSDWNIDCSGGRDIGGWEYTKELRKFDSRVPRGKKLTDRYRRRRWIRAMRPQPDRQLKEINEAGLQLESVSETTGMGAPALHVHAYECDAEDFQLDLGGNIDVHYLPAPEVHQRNHIIRTPLGIPAFGHAVTAVKEWWTEEFTFRGFGIGIVKPIFRGTFLRPDVGLGIRLPLTLHFRSWENQEALPSISASFFILWPPAVQVSQAWSYPAELLQEWATAAARKIAVPSKEAFQARQRKEAVQRLGFSMGVRYSATYGFQYWLAPYFFLLPGVRVLWHLYQSMMTLLLSSIAIMQRSDVNASGSRTEKDENEEALWLAALRLWAAAKTSGLGYSLYYSGSNLGGAVLINFMPFFLPMLSMNRAKAKETTLIDEPAIEHDMLASMEATETEEDGARRDVVATRVAVGMGDGAELVAADSQRQEDRIGLQACPA